MNHLSDRELSCVGDLLRNMTSEIGELVTLGLGGWASVMELKRHLTLMKKEVAAEGRSPRRQCRYDMTADERRQGEARHTPQNDTFEQLSQVTRLGLQAYGLKISVELALRKSTSEEVRRCAKAACDCLDAAMAHLEDIVKSLSEQKSRNLMDLLGQAHEGK